MTSKESNISTLDITARLPVWRALSELFLDNELSEYDIKYVATGLRDSGFSLEDIESILWNEVFPALADNLRVVAGEWGMFQDNWLTQRILDVMTGKESHFHAYGLISVERVRVIITELWSQVCICLES